MIARPSMVTRAVWLVYAGILMSVVSFYYNFDYTSQQVMIQLQSQPGVVSHKAVMIFSIASLVLGLVFYAWLNYKISQGRNWARVVFLVFVLFNFFVLIKNLTFAAQLYHASVIGFGLSLLPLICNVIVAFLLFFSSGSKWFSKKQG